MKAGLGAQRSQVKFLERARIVGNKGIDTSDLMAALEQFLAEMGTNKSGGSSDNAGCHVGRVSFVVRMVSITLPEAQKLPGGGMLSGRLAQIVMPEQAGCHGAPRSPTLGQLAQRQRIRAGRQILDLLCCYLQGEV